MARLRERLSHDAQAGAWNDGPRRYLLLRPDGLMGAFRALDPAAGAQALDALAVSVQRHGGDSLRAYASSVGGDVQALVAATIEAAADLGWGRWQLERQSAGLVLTVQGSPFAQGWCAAGADAPGAHAARAARDAPGPARALDRADGADAAGASRELGVCAPIRGMLAALAGLVLAAPVRVRECECEAQGHAACRFEAVIGQDVP